ncbi:hypothetical protein B0H17DRAFT_1146849 [Mycena rosella]|uniref:Uncharacterized protein n=1 Tax=Mycena rosella TaxID=1033263 RepID=A0AAD7G4E9_MYCRO|nr:hypothetical protein B0H17DRAFT_1146849 [Mycena rosella]
MFISNWHSLADHRFPSPLPPSHPICPPEAAISLPLPQLAPSTLEEHQENASVAVHQATELVSIFNTYWWGCEQAAQLHEMEAEESSTFNYEMQERAQIYGAGLGPLAHAYHSPLIPSCMGWTSGTTSTLAVVRPGAVGFYTAVAEDIAAGFTPPVGPDGAYAAAPQVFVTAVWAQAQEATVNSVSDRTTDIFDRLPGSSSIPTSAASNTSNPAGLPVLLALDSAPAPVIFLGDEQGASSTMTEQVVSWLDEMHGPDDLRTRWTTMRKTTTTSRLANHKLYDGN